MILKQKKTAINFTTTTKKINYNETQVPQTNKDSKFQSKTIKLI